MLTERLHQTFSAHKISYELIFIDDFSTDDTVDELSALAKTYPIKIQTKKGKRGKAQSLLQGFDLASSEILVMIDADLQYPPEAIPQMLEKINNGFDVVVASRSQKHVSFVRLFLSRGFEFVFGRLLHNFNFDVQSGLKAFRRKIIDEVELKPDAWTFDLEFLTKARTLCPGLCFYCRFRGYHVSISGADEFDEGCLRFDRRAAGFALHCGPDVRNRAFPRPEGRSFAREAGRIRGPHTKAVIRWRIGAATPDRCRRRPNRSPSRLDQRPRRPSRSSRRVRG